MTGLYVHVPFCVRKCAYCDFYSLPGMENRIADYVRAVLSEASFYCYSSLRLESRGGDEASNHGSVKESASGSPSKYPSLPRGKGLRDGALPETMIATNIKPAPPYRSERSEESGGRAEKTQASHCKIIFDTLYFGGGTPSILGTQHLTSLMNGLRQTFDLNRIVEATVEVNPDTSTPEFLQSAIDCGINRVSVGVQSLDDSELQSVGRVHTASQAIEALKLARQIGFKSVSADLMVGLPGQTWSSLEYSIRLVTDAGVDHLSLYCLSIEEDTPLCAYPPANLPSDDLQAELFEKSRRLLIELGFRHYEISNFSRPGFECLHNLNYWRGGEYFGLGPAAASHISGLRFKNRPDLEAYLVAPDGQLEFDEKLSEGDKIAEEAMIRLRLLVEGLNPSVLEDRFSRASINGLVNRLNAMVEKGFLEYRQMSYRLPASRILTSNEIFQEVLGLKSKEGLVPPSLL